MRIKNVRTTLYSVLNSTFQGKVLLRGFDLNGHTLGFHSQTQKLELPCTKSTLYSITNSTAGKYCSVVFT